MNNDPIVEEVRRVRDELARRFNYDIHDIFADLRMRQQAGDAAHPLVKDAGEWAEAQEAATGLREEPPKPDPP